MAMAMTNRGSINFSSDDELLSHQSAAEEQGQHRTNTYRRGVVAALGALAVFACLAFVSVADKRPQQLTARSLFDHPDIHDVATANVMKVGDKMIGGLGDQKPVRRLVAEVMRNVSRNLSPADAKALDNTPITEQQKNAIVHVMSYLADPRAQMLGVKVAHAVRDADSEDPEVMKAQVAKGLAPYIHQMRHLHGEIFPEDSPIRETVGNGKGAGFEALLLPKRVALMKTVDDQWDMHFDIADSHLEPATDRKLSWGASPSTSSNGLDTSSDSGSSAGWGGSSGSSSSNSAGTAAITSAATGKGLLLSKGTLGIIGAVLTEATSLLRIVKPTAKMFGHDLNVAPAVTTGLGASDYMVELAACWVDAAVDGGNPVEVMSCPMEFGSEFMDAGRELFTLLGILGDNNPANGVQGNHGDNETVAQGMLDDLFSS